MPMLFGRRTASIIGWIMSMVASGDPALVVGEDAWEVGLAHRVLVNAARAWLWGQGLGRRESGAALDEAKGLQVNSEDAIKAIVR